MTRPGWPSSSHSKCASSAPAAIRLFSRFASFAVRIADERLRCGEWIMGLRTDEIACPFRHVVSLKV